MTIDSLTPAEQLKTWIMSGSFTPQPAPTGWSHRQINDQQADQVAMSFPHVAAGLLDLASLGLRNPQIPELSTSHDLSSVFLSFDDVEPGSTAVVSAIHPVDNRLTDSLSRLFAANGNYKIKLCSLMVHPTNPAKTQMCLVMPHRYDRFPSETLLNVSFYLDGRTELYSSTPKIRQRSVFKYMIGQATKDEVFSLESWRSHKESEAEALIGPGSLKNLRDHLPTLGRYYTDIATRYEL